jgi:hypothetical protein
VTILPGRGRVLLLVFTILVASFAVAVRFVAGELVDPVYREANSCTELAPEGFTWSELRIPAPVSDSYANEYLTVTLDVYSDTLGPAFDWWATELIDAVYVMGGPGGNLYQYRPPGPAVYADTGLHAPANPGGNYRDIEEVLFCYTEGLEPTSTPTATETITVTATVTPTGTTAPTATNAPTATATPTATTTGTPFVTPTAPPTETPPAETPTPTATVPPPPSDVALHLPLLAKVTGPGGEEPNDRCADAYPIVVNYTHHFLPDDMHDWFTFVLPAAANLRIVVDHFIPLDGQIAAYRGERCTPGELQLLQNYGFPGLTKTLDLGQQPAGRYYLYVSNDGEFSDTEPYRLTITAEE